MPQDRQIAREISYAPSARTRGGRAVIRAMEAMSGRGGLIRRAEGFHHDLAAGRDVWEVMVARYGLSLNLLGGALDMIPRDGPVIVVANHPYGLLDGLMMGHILSRARSDFRILAHRVFDTAPVMGRAILPISFDGTRAAMEMNLVTRSRALEYLAQGGAVGIFPGGAVSTAARPFARPMDPGWRRFTARMVARSRATVVPVFFDGQTSRLFQVASHVHSTLRMGLLIREFGKRVDMPVDVVIGAPLTRADLDPLAGDAKSLMAFLRMKTYELSPRPIDPRGTGFEWD